MMLYPAINELKDKTDSRYTLCILAAKRARDIISGKPVLTEVKAERPVSLAANEIYEDRITYCRKNGPQVVGEEEIAEEAVEEAAEAVEEAVVEAAEEVIEAEEAIEEPVEA